MNPYRSIISAGSTFSILSSSCGRRYKVDFVDDTRYALRPTKYTTLDVLENMLSSEPTDLGVGVLLARYPQCVTRHVENFLPSNDYISRLSLMKQTKITKSVFMADDGGSGVLYQSNANSTSIDNSNPQLNLEYTSTGEYQQQLHSSIDSDSNSNSDTVDAHHYTSIRETVEETCRNSEPQHDSKRQSNPLRLPYETTFLFVKSNILFPDEWYIPTLFVSKYMNIHEAANSVKYDVLHLNDEKATIASPFPSISVTEPIPKNHPLYEKMKRKINIFIYRATYHGFEDLQYDTDVIQDAQWLTADEAKSVLKPSFYGKLSTIF